MARLLKLKFECWSLLPHLSACDDEHGMGVGVCFTFADGASCRGEELHRRQAANN